MKVTNINPVGNLMINQWSECDQHKIMPSKSAKGTTGNKRGYISIFYLFLN